MAKLFFPWLLLIIAIFVRLVLGAPNQLTPEGKRQESQECANRCEKLDHTRQCRLSIPCLLEYHDASRILMGGGCPHCKRADPRGKCRLILSCVMGFS